MNEREPEALTRRLGGTRDGEVILYAVVSVCISVEYLLARYSGHRVRGRDDISGCIRSAYKCRCRPLRAGVD